MTLPPSPNRQIGVGDGVRQLVDGACLVPAQWEARSDGLYGTPCGLLWAAVLEDACHLLVLTRHTHGVKAQRLYRQTRGWFVGDTIPCTRAQGDGTCTCTSCWPLSFVNCCETLGIDADKLRRRVLDGHPVFAGRRYRVAVSRGLGQQRLTGR